MNDGIGYRCFYRSKFWGIVIKMQNFLNFHKNFQFHRNPGLVSVESEKDLLLIGIKTCFYLLVMFILTSLAFGVINLGETLARNELLQQQIDLGLLESSFAKLVIFPFNLVWLGATASIYLVLLVGICFGVNRILEDVEKSSLTGSAAITLNSMSVVLAANVIITVLNGILSTVFSIEVWTSSFLKWSILVIVLLSFLYSFYSFVRASEVLGREKLGRASATYVIGHIGSLWILLTLF